MYLLVMLDVVSPKARSQTQHFTCTKFHFCDKSATAILEAEQSEPMIIISVPFLEFKCSMNPCTDGVSLHWKERRNV